MPPQIAALICSIFVLYVLRLDLKQSHGSSKALWVPIIWMGLAGSRFVSQWLGLSEQKMSADAYIEGSPLDATVFLTLIVLGITILIQRKINWVELLRNNYWIWVYFLFAGISILWSDIPLASFKRWIKALGDIIVALIILTDREPNRAFAIVLRRLAYLLIPLSVLFIRFYPELGRFYHQGAPILTGVATHKNTLGQICVISGIYFLWSLLLDIKEERRLGGTKRISIDIVMLVMVFWLLYRANSATSVATMGAMGCLLFISRSKAMVRRPMRLVIVAVLALSISAFLEYAMDISAVLISALDRDPSLTTRVPVWDMLLSLGTNPIIGVGYESFWSGQYLPEIWREFGMIIQSHNGYLDLYLNLGIIGLFFLCCSVAKGLSTAIKQLNYEYATAVIKICFISVFIMSNWTENVVRPITTMFIIILVVLLNPSKNNFNKDSNGKKSTEN
jgi:exopolysaccharide production protein ExoQ